jgi:4-diphosphocytidyl-2-C-methyl-D-erythritol kinase
MSRRVELLAPAKLNLGLELVARRSDGYHDIQTVFLPLRLYDRLVIEPTPDRGVSLDVGSAELSLDAENLAVRAAEAVCQALDPQLGVRIELRKQIPIAAGLGGGSSDAAAALMGVEALAAEPLDPERRAAIARTLGADVPFFLNPVPCVGRGIGDQLEPLPGLPEMHWVLLLSRLACRPRGHIARRRAN